MLGNARILQSMNGGLKPFKTCPFIAYRIILRNETVMERSNQMMGNDGVKPNKT